MTFLLSRNFWFWPKSYLYFCSTRNIPGLWRMRCYLADNQMNWKGSTVWFQVSCHKGREEATPFTVFGKLEVREFCVNSHRRVFLSSTSCSVLWPVKCTLPSSGALVPTGTKARLWGIFFFLAVLGVYFLYGHFSIWDKWGLLSACRVHGFSLRWLLWLWSTSSRHTRFTSFATQAQYLSFSLVAPWHVRSSQNKDRTHVSHTGKLTFYHAATSVLGKLKK